MIQFDMQMIGVCYLFGGHRFIYRIDVAEIISHLHLVRFAAMRKFTAHKRWIGDGFLECSDHFVTWIARTLFIVVACEVIAAVDTPVLLENILDAFASVLHDR